MHVIRPATIIDVPAVERLLADHGISVTSLPQDRERLADIITSSVRSFGDRETEFPFFLFLMEDSESGDVVGAAGIESRAGSGYPFFNYRLEDLVHASHHLEVKNRVPVLHLSHELSGSTVLKSCVMKHCHKQGDSFALLMRARLMFLAAFRELFADTLCVEIQGVLNEQGESEFWNNIGRLFFDIDFAEADYYAGVKSKTFIAELMPQHPVYVPLLSDAARAAINRPHPVMMPNVRILEEEGFAKTRYVDIFDGGPVLTAEQKNLKTIHNYRTKYAQPGQHLGGRKYLISNQDMKNFRCVIGNLVDGIGDTVRLSPDVIRALQLDEQSQVGYSLL